jgi:hypothetical protein
VTGAPGVDDPHDGSPEIGVLVRRALRRHVNVDVVSEPAVDELGVSLVVDFVLAVIVCAPGVGVRRRTAELGLFNQKGTRKITPCGPPKVWKDPEP